MAENNRNKLEQPGNVIASAAGVERIMAKLGGLLYTVDAMLSEQGDADVRITGIRFRIPEDGVSDWMAVVTATTENGSLVAFHGGNGLANTIEGVMNRIRNGSLKWKEDQYA